MDNVSIYVYILLSLILILQTLFTVVFYKKFKRQENEILELKEQVKISKTKTDDSFQKLFVILEEKDKGVSDLKANIITNNENIQKNISIINENIIYLKCEIQESRNDLNLRDSLKTSNSLKKPEIERKIENVIENSDYNELSKFSDISLDNVRISINKLEAEVNLQDELKLMKNESEKDKIIKDFLIKTELKNIKENKK